MESGKSRIVAAEFIKTAPGLRDLPPPTLPEVAFIGRSNVGKSSLLNTICQRQSLARTSRTPGRTQALNYFQIEFILDEEEQSHRKEGYFVDLPGYGFAQVAAKVKAEWPELIKRYLLERETLRAVLLLVDSRREIGEEERWITELGRDGGFYLVLTKADKISRNELAEKKRRTAKELAISPELIYSTALVGKNKTGADELRDTVCRLLL